MDASTLISPLIGLIAPIIVSAIRRPSSKIEERTARLQYWKTFFEVAPLAGSTVSEDSKQLCLAEMAEGEDETRNFNNKVVSSITTAYTLIVMFVAMRSGIVYVFSNPTPDRIQRLDIGQVFAGNHSALWVSSAGRNRDRTDRIPYCLPPQRSIIWTV